MSGQLDPIALMRKIGELESKIKALKTIEIGGIWTNYTPTVTASGSMTITDLVVDTARYTLIGNSMGLEISISFTTGGTASNQVDITFPFSIITATYRSFYSGVKQPNFSPGWVYAPGASSFGVRRYDGANYTLTTSVRIQANAFIKYR